MPASASPSETFVTTELTLVSSLTGCTVTRAFLSTLPVVGSARNRRGAASHLDALAGEVANRLDERHDCDAREAGQPVMRGLSDALEDGRGLLPLLRAGGTAVSPRAGFPSAQ